MAARPGVVYAFGDCDDAAAVLSMTVFHVGQEILEAEDALGHIDQVRPVVRGIAGRAPRLR